MPCVKGADTRSTVRVVINPIAGAARRHAVDARVRLARDILAAHSVAGDVVVTERVGHARLLTTDAVADGARLVVAWGGDGTINEVASALVGSGAALGIVPAGSGNGLAREIGIERQADRALAAAVHATPQPIDVGDVDGRFFVNVAGIGFDAHVAARFASARRRGFLGYAGITARALATYAPLDYRVSVDGGEPILVRAVLVTIANSAQFGNGAIVAPGARLDDGLLDLVVFEERSRLRTVLAVPRLFNGSVDRIAGCRITRLREVEIAADVPLTYHVDGEPATGGTTLTVRVHPAALLVAGFARPEPAIIEGTATRDEGDFVSG